MWGRTAATYADGFEAMTGAAAEATLDAAGVGLGSHVLDVGTGPGTLIGPALARGATVIALDLTDEMINEARQRFPDVEIRVGKASDLPFDVESFDAVTLGFCVHHMAEPARALTEAHRVLRPGGRIAFTVWGEAERCEAIGIALTALAEIGLGGSDDAPQPPLPFGQPLTDYQAALEQAGFLQPIARNLDIGWRVRGAAPIIDGFERYAGLAQLVSDEQRAAFRRRHRQGHQLASPTRRHHLPPKPRHPRRRPQGLLIAPAGHTAAMRSGSPPPDMLGARTALPTCRPRFNAKADTGNGDGTGTSSRPAPPERSTYTRTRQGRCSRRHANPSSRSGTLPPCTADTLREVPLVPPAAASARHLGDRSVRLQNDGSASARGEAPPIVAFPTPPAIKTDPRPNVAARRSALMV